MATQVEIEASLDTEDAIKGLVDIEKQTVKTAKSVVQLEKETDDLKKKLKGLKVGSKEFKLLAKEIAKSDSALKNAQKSLEGLDADAKAGEIGKLAGGLGNVATASALAFGDNKDAEAFFQTFASGLAVTNALKGGIEVYTATVKLSRAGVIQETVAVVKNTAAKVGNAVSTSALAIGTTALTVAQGFLTTILGTSTGALRLFKIALISTGIGAIVVGIGLLIANFDKVREAVIKVIKIAFAPLIWQINLIKKGLVALGLIESDTEKAQKKARAAQRERAEARIKELDKEIEAVKLRNKIEDNRAKRVVKQVQRELALLKAKGGTEEELAAKQLEVDAAKNKQFQQDKQQAEFDAVRNKEKLETLVNLNNTELGLILDLDKFKRLSESNELEAINLLDDAYKKSGAGFKFYNEEKVKDLKLFLTAKLKADEEVINSEEAIADNSNEVNIRILNDEKAANDKRVAEAKKRNERLKKLELDRLKLEQDLRVELIADENERSLAELKLQQERELKEVVNKFGRETEVVKLLKQRQANELLELQKEIDAAEDERIRTIAEESFNAGQEKRDAELEAEAEANNKRLELDNKYREEKDKRDKEEAEKLKQREADKVQAARSTLTIISNLAELFAGESEAQQKKAFQIQKAARIGQATISAIEGTQNAFTSASASPLTGIFPAYPYIQAAAAATFGALSVKNIASSKFGGSSSGGSIASSTTGSTASSTPAPSSVNLFGTAGQTGGQDTQTAGTNQQPSAQVYVLESDISATQNNLVNIEERATFN